MHRKGETHDAVGEHSVRSTVHNHKRERRQTPMVLSLAVYQLGLKKIEIKYI